MVSGKPKEPLGNLDRVVNLLFKYSAALLLLHSRLHSRLLHSWSAHHTGLLHTRLLHLHASWTRRSRSPLHLLRCRGLLAVEATASRGRRCGYSAWRARRRRRTGTRRGRLLVIIKYRNVEWGATKIQQNVSEMNL